MSRVGNGKVTIPAMEASANAIHLSFAWQDYGSVEKRKFALFPAHS